MPIFYSPLSLKWSRATPQSLPKNAQPLSFRFRDPEYIRNTRKKMKLSQERLANLLGVDAQTVARWEKGQSVMRRNVALTFAELIPQFMSISADEAPAESLGDLAAVEEGQKEWMRKHPGKHRIARQPKTPTEAQKGFSVEFLRGVHERLIEMGEGGLFKRKPSKAEEATRAWDEAHPGTDALQLEDADK